MVGMLFYILHNQFSMSQSFYMCISTGYSIGWGYPIDPNWRSKLFSIFYIWVGGLTLSICLALFKISDYEFVV